MCAVSYSVRMKASAAQRRARIDVHDRRVLVEHIDRLATDPHVGTVLKREFTGLRRIRMGAYRVVFEVRPTELVVLVVRVAHRSSLYRR